MTKFTKHPIVLFVALTVLISSTAGIPPRKAHQTDKKTVTVKNSTKFNIDNVYMSPDEEDHWGNDILGDNEILKPGESIEVEVDCGKWDVKLVADDDSECQVEDITLCEADEWNIVADC